MMLCSVTTSITPLICINQVLAKEPGLIECRKVLRTAQLRKAGAGGGFFKKMLSSAGSSPMVAKGHMALGKDPAEALRIAEQILNGDPHSSAAHKLVVEAATALELPKTAVLSLEILAANSPKDRDVAIKFANALADFRRGGAGGEDSGGPSSMPSQPTTNWVRRSKTSRPARR